MSLLMPYFYINYVRVCLNTQKVYVCAFLYIYIHMYDSETFGTLRSCPGMTACAFQALGLGFWVTVPARS